MKQSKSPLNVDVDCDDITLQSCGMSLLLTSVPVRLVAALSGVAILWLMLSHLVEWF